MRGRRSGFVVCALLVSAQGLLRAQAPRDVSGVERAALDYLEGFYEGDAAKIERGVHPEVVKYGFYVPSGGTEYAGEPMTYQEMLDFARRVKERADYPAATAPKEVRVLEVLDQTAAVRVTAWWGSDYLHLAKYDGAWKIIHVLWQTSPRAPS